MRLPSDHDGLQGGPPKNQSSGEEAGLLRALFLDEAEKHLTRIIEAQKTLTRAAETSLNVAPDVVDSLFRHLHTLKGSAGSVGFEAISASAHELEELCVEIRKGQLAPTLGILERIEDGIAEIRALLTSARIVVPSIRTSILPLESSTGDFQERRQASDRRSIAERRTGSDGILRIEMERLDHLVQGLGDMFILGTRLDRRAHEAQCVLKDLASIRRGLRDIENQLTRPAQGPSDNKLQLLDHLVEVDTKLSDAASYLERTTRTLSLDTRALRGTSVDVEAELRQARLVPLEWGFIRLDSALHELERVCQRTAKLVVAGGDIKIDKSLIDQLLEPLLHLLRNAMAHGIETPEARLAHGKTAHGNISITAKIESDALLIVFEDDGGGIDQNRVRQTLESLGKVRPGEILSKDELFAAIYEPGFSTRSSSDALSGRGLGLDIVKRSISRMGGGLHLESTMGEGTRFRFSVPLPGTITQGILFKLGGQVYAVPATHVIQVLPVGHNLLSGSARSSSESAEVPALSGTQLPILKLHAILGAELPPGRQAAAMHIRYAGRNFLLTCDKVIGPRTIVVRPTGPLLGLVPIYAGVTVSGAGKVQLVFDLGALTAYLDRPILPTLMPRRGQPRILIVDYSRLGREAAARLLATAGYQTVTAEDGYEAWDLLGERRFDAVITGLEMPRLDGFQLISRIRREPTLLGLPVVVLSYRTSQGNRERCMAAGADVFLPKSRQRKSLVEAISACLATRGQTATT